MGAGPKGRREMREDERLKGGFNKCLKKASQGGLQGRLQGGEAPSGRWLKMELKGVSGEGRELGLEGSSLFPGGLKMFEVPFGHPSWAPRVQEASC